MVYATHPHSGHQVCPPLVLFRLVLHVLGGCKWRGGVQRAALSVHVHAPLTEACCVIGPVMGPTQEGVP